MFGDLGKIMKLVSDVKTRLPEMKRQLNETLFTASSGGGAVTATVNGTMALTSLEISEEAKNDCSGAELSEVITAAISAAQAQARQANADMMKEIAGDTDISGLADMLG